jgi:hypothetical protein
MSKMPLMKCGHVAQGTDSATGEPTCIICVGLLGGATEVDPAPPSLEGRVATCAYRCGATRPSSYDLAFFEYRGPGCKDAELKCTCGYFKTAHGRGGFGCSSFKPHGPWADDQFYCGCRGWD